MLVTEAVVLFMVASVLTDSKLLTHDEIREICKSLIPSDTLYRRFLIQNVKSKLVMDIHGKSERAGADVIMAPMDKSASQQWTYQENAIVSVHSGLSMAVGNTGLREANPVNMQKWDNGNDKQFLFELDGHILVVHWYQLLTDFNNGSLAAKKRAQIEEQIFERIYV